VITSINDDMDLHYARHVKLDPKISFGSTSPAKPTLAGFGGPDPNKASDQRHSGVLAFHLGDKWNRVMQQTFSCFSFAPSVSLALLPKVAHEGAGFLGDLAG
jgi:hypothetical protein